MYQNKDMLDESKRTGAVSKETTSAQVMKDFIEVLGEFDNATTCLVVDPKAAIKRSSIRLFAKGTVGGEEGLFETPLNVDDGNFGAFYGRTMLENTAGLLKEYGKDVVDQAFATSGMFALIKDANHAFMAPISAEVLNRDTAQYKLPLPDGETPGYYYTGLLAQRMNAGVYTFCMRQSDESPTTKIFGIRSSAYGHFPQTEVFQCVIEAFKDKRLEMKEWEVANDFTKAILELPDDATNRTYGKTQAHLVPRILFETSDVGTSSASARLYWANPDNPREEYYLGGNSKTLASRKHYGNWGVRARNDLVKACAELVNKVTAFNEQMDKLATIQVENQYIGAVTENWLDDAGVRKLNKGNADKLVKHVENEFAGRDTNAAELCMFIMNMPNTPILREDNGEFKISDTAIKALRLALAEVPYKPVKKGIIVRQNS